MILYHFTAQHHWEGGGGHAGPGIRNVGLRPNAHPLIALPPGVWLTTADDFRQTWAPRAVPLPDGSVCDRTQVRLTVDIPRQSRGLLHGMVALRLCMRTGDYRDLTAFGDPDAWRLFLGSVPREWIIAVDERSAVAA